jgi:hypothetical protein
MRRNAYPQLTLMRGRHRFAKCSSLGLTLGGVPMNPVAVRTYVPRVIEAKLGDSTVRVITSPKG